MTGIGWGELAMLLVVGLVVFGPERLPGVVADVVRTVRQLRAQAGAVTDVMKEQLAEHVDVDELRRLDRRRGLDDADADADRGPARRRPARAAAGAGAPTAGATGATAPGS